MAELGPIQFTDLERGVTRPSRGQDEVRALGTTLNVLDKWRVDDVLGDFREDAEDVISEAREEASTATVFDAPSTLEGPEGDIQRRAGVLRAQIDQGNSSQRGLAELELKRLLNQAQAEHPALASQLQQQFGSTVTASARLDEIGLIDTINKQNAQAAEKEYRAMIDFAQAKHPSGLGINPSINPASAEFAKQYTERSTMFDTIERNKLQVAFAASTTDMSVRNKSTIINKSIAGFGNLVNAGVEEHFDTLMRYRSEIAKPEGERDLQFMENFSSNIRPAIIEDLNAKKFQLQSSLDQFFGSVEERATPFYADTKAKVDDALAQVDALIATFTGDDISAVDHQIASWRIRNADFRRDNPDYNSLLIAMDPTGDNFLEFYNSVAKLDQTGMDVRLGQDIANIGLGALTDLIGQVPPENVPSEVTSRIFQDGGQGKVNDNMDPRAIQTTLRSNWGQSNGFYGNANSTEEEDIRASIAHLEMLRNTSRSAIDQASPYTAGQFLTTSTNALLVMDAIGNPAPDQIKATEDILADPDVYEASLLGGNEQNRNRRLAFGDAAQEFYANTRPNERAQEWRRRLEKPILGGVPLRNFITFSTTGTDSKSEFTFAINKESLKAQLKATLGSGVNDGQVQAYERRIMSEVAPVLKEINSSIRTSAHIDAWLQPTIEDVTADYLNAADQLGWVDYFLPRP